MTTELAFHYPPDVFDAVVDAVPLLTRGKKDVVLFFRGCGVDRTFLARIERRIDAEPTYSKYHITREILAHVNELGDRGLGQRRQVLKRVSEFDDFSSCYPDNQLKARGAVAAVAQLINKKDSFTRLQEERERELREHREAKRAGNAKREAERVRREQVKADLFALFGEQNPHRRGKALEGVLNRLFEVEQILIRDAFEIRDQDATGGTIEQIDGAIELDGRVYLVEMKWWPGCAGRERLRGRACRLPRNRRDCGSWRRRRGQSRPGPHTAGGRRNRTRRPRAPSPRPPGLPGLGHWIARHQPGPHSARDLRRGAGSGEGKRGAPGE